MIFKRWRKIDEIVITETRFVHAFSNNKKKLTCTFYTVRVYASCIVMHSRTICKWMFFCRFQLLLFDSQRTYIWSFTGINRHIYIYRLTVYVRRSLEDEINDYETRRGKYGCICTRLLIPGKLSPVLFLLAGEWKIFSNNIYRVRSR